MLFLLSPVQAQRFKGYYPTVVIKKRDSLLCLYTGTITLQDVYIDDNLWIYVCPQFVQNYLLTEEGSGKGKHRFIFILILSVLSLKSIFY